jgi:hypothetical protein
MGTFSLVILPSTNHLIKTFLPITDPLVEPPNKKLNVPFTISQDQSYYFRQETKPLTGYSLVVGKQSLDYLDYNILIPVWNDYMYHNEIKTSNLHGFHPKSFNSRIILLILTIIQNYTSRFLIID